MSVSSCTMVADGNESPLNAGKEPSIPSRPAVATSTIWPSSSTVTIEQKPPPGK
jgi:hypothetical protein